MLVSFIAGPYYDEYRFTKYFMIGMIGFASLMIYELLSHKLTNKSLIRAVFISAIITSSGLSVLTLGCGIAVYYAVPDAWLKVAWGAGAAAATYLALTSVLRPRAG